MDFLRLFLFHSVFPATCFLGVILGFVIVIVFAGSDWPKRVWRYTPYLGIFFGALVICLSVSVTFWYETPTKIGLLVTMVNGEIVEHPYGAFEWQDYMCVPRYYVYSYDYDKARTVESTVYPITTNPKVRHFKYEVMPEVFDPYLYLADPKNQNLDKWRANQRLLFIVQRCLFEFNEENSRELAKFYNPLDEEQIEEFNELIESWVNERLAPVGVQISGQGFSFIP